MARYMKTVDLWDADTVDAIQSGELVLQAGQWCQCGSGPKSRFVGLMSGGSIWCTHWQGTGTATQMRFLTCRKLFSQGVR